MTKEMKIIGGSALCLMILLVGVSFAAATEPPVNEGIYELPEVSADSLSLEEDTSAGTAPIGYVVKSDGSEVGVYSPSGEKLMALDILPTKLRSSDAAELEKGIAVADDEALARLIEDFSS